MRLVVRACVNYTVLCVRAQPARMCILGEKSIPRVHLLCLLIYHAHLGETHTSACVLSTQWVYMGGSWGQLCANPKLWGTQKRGSSLKKGRCRDLKRPLFCPGGPPSPSLCSLPEAEAPLLFPASLPCTGCPAFFLPFCTVDYAQIT